MRELAGPSAGQGQVEGEGCRSLPTPCSARTRGLTHQGPGAVPGPPVLLGDADRGLLTRQRFGLYPLSRWNVRGARVRQFTPHINAPACIDLAEQMNRRQFPSGAL